MFLYNTRTYNETKPQPHAHCSRVTASVILIIHYIECYRTFEWNYVVGVYEDTSYGVNGYQDIEKYAMEEHICIAESFKVRRYGSWY